jgi:alpha-L-fucosidase 2
LLVIVFEAFVIAGVVLVAIVTNAAAIDLPTWKLERAGAIDRWDEAMPLGNGMLGALVWGDGHTVRLSIDRGDLWDLRVPDTLKRPDWTWATIQKLRDAGDFKTINALFDVPYDTVPYPTKLPGGRIELIFPDPTRVSGFALDLSSAEVVVSLSDGDVRVRMDAVLGIGLMSIRGPQPQVRLVRPAGLDKLGYAPATQTTADREWTLSQADALNLSHAVIVRRDVPSEGSAPQRYAFTIAASRDGGDPLTSGRTRVATALAVADAQARSRHLDWWTRFWQTSSVTIPEPRLQRHYDLVKYFYGAASRPDAPPIPLQGVWTADEGGLPPWKGDYHHDLNTQMTYLAYPTAGLFDQGASFLNQLWDLLPRFREFAKAFYGVDGAIVPGVMAADGQPLGGWGQYSLSPTNAPWVAQSFYVHWRYTGDDRFLRERAYPWCAEVGRALLALLQSSNGRLVLPLSSSPEIFDNSPRAWLTPNSNYDLALMRFLFTANAEMALAMGKTTEASGWMLPLTQLDRLRVDPQTSALMVADGVPFNTSHRHFSHAMAIYPLGTMTVEGSDADQKTIAATLDDLVRLGTREWVGYSFSWMSAMAARAAQPDRALEFLRTYERAFIGPNGFHLNGDQTRSGLSAFTYRPFTLEGNFLAMQAVHEMLLQSWGGVVRVFPATSVAWQTASFEKLRAEGGWVVSADRTGGRTTRVEIRATIGGVLRLRDSFGGARVTWNRSDIKKQGADFVVTLKAGDALSGVTR